MSIVVGIVGEIATVRFLDRCAATRFKLEKPEDIEARQWGEREETGNIAGQLGINRT